ncbi:MAG: AraC family transcriptional regulator [Bradyrhizobium sp.]|uniref:AraC family transcriptional regulator n=1 Tax=Bradyrhizobium sp. TaxID=376 RepID=UPI0025C06A1F|nr:AraC family transcriptional regulator [Bradyrhizobium sp.]MBI5262874.1 AraC family transcriptional regulator [Bradyrhizobium sp.]
MNENEGTPTLAPRTFRFTDIDEFRSSIRQLTVDFTPLVRTIKAEQTILNLPGCDVNLIKSFPRIVDAQLAPNCTVVGFGMDDQHAPIRFNGVETDRSVIVLGSDGAGYSLVEQAERQCASVVFTPAVRGRGWPETGPSFRMFETSASARLRLRGLVREVLSFAASDTLHPGVSSAAIRESFLGAVDAALDDVVAARWTARANSVRHFKIFHDIRAVLSDDLSRPVYSEELAKKVGVSVRTVHDVVKRYRGMSLHRYLRLRRLWLVRKRLLLGAESVKAVALAYGFWHLSDFSRSYRLHFGETPSETVERARNA